MRYSGDYDFYSREEIDALVRTAASEQDAAVYLTAAMTGLRRGELVALRWRDIDFPGQAIRVRANYSHGGLVTPKSGKVRSVPMVPEVAQALARLSQRELFMGHEDPVFVGQIGQHMDASALRRRYANVPKALSCAHYRSTHCATTSARWRSIAPRSCRFNRGWAMHISRRPLATYMPRAKQMTPRCLPAHSHHQRRMH